MLARAHERFERYVGTSSKGEKPSPEQTHSMGAKISELGRSTWCPETHAKLAQMCIDMLPAEPVASPSTWFPLNSASNAGRDVDSALHVKPLLDMFEQVASNLTHQQIEFLRSTLLPHSRGPATEWVRSHPLNSPELRELYDPPEGTSGTASAAPASPTLLPCAPLSGVPAELSSWEAAGQDRAWDELVRARGDEREDIAPWRLATAARRCLEARTLPSAQCLALHADWSTPASLNWLFDEGRHHFSGAPLHASRVSRMWASLLLYKPSVWAPVDGTPWAARNVDTGVELAGESWTCSLDGEPVRAGYLTLPTAAGVQWGVDNYGSARLPHLPARLELRAGNFFSGVLPGLRPTDLEDERGKPLSCLATGAVRMLVVAS